MTTLPPSIEEWRLRELEKKIEKQEHELDELRDRMRRQDEERVMEDRSRLKWGITALGTVVMTLLGIIWSFRKVIVGG